MTICKNCGHGLKTHLPTPHMKDKHHCIGTSFFGFIDCNCVNPESSLLSDSDKKRDK